MMERQTKIILLAALGVAAILLFSRSAKAAPAVAQRDPILASCEDDYLNAVHPDIERTPEELAEYRKNWISECIESKTKQPNEKRT